MQVIIRRRFVPSNYFWDLHKKLQILTQDSKSMRNVFMIKANINKDKEVTMTRFLNGLSHKIVNVMELQTLYRVGKHNAYERWNNNLREKVFHNKFKVYVLFHHEGQI